jgi:hypothetical protein
VRVTKWRGTAAVGAGVGLALFGLRALPAALAATTVLVRECGPLLLLAGGAAGRVALAATLVLVLECGPLLLLADGAAGAGDDAAGGRGGGERAAAGLAVPLGAGLSAWAMARSGWRAARQGGLVWRSTFHSRAELLSGRRFRP